MIFILYALLIFQSTLPAWGATAARSYAEAWRIEFQSTLPAWGATLRFAFSRVVSMVFQSTLPAWGATYLILVARILRAISIHAPRMGSDVAANNAFNALSSNFNPRSPHGERRHAPVI